MALNTWWESHPEQRYWMEITSREYLGENLLAPQTDYAGNEQWSYALVSHVRPGDRILHYRTNATGGAAILGWSEAVGPVSEGTIEWQPRGTRGRARGYPTTGPSWYVPLGGFRELPTPVLKAELAEIEDELFRTRTDLESLHSSPVYFPFSQYRPGEIRAQQGYLAKFPVELFDILPALAPVTAVLGGVVDEAEEVEEEAGPRTRRVARGTTTRIQDPVLRSAIECHAVDAAISYYTSKGMTEHKVLGKPYDLLVVVDGTERHVEVKGSSTILQTVELTFNEVAHADDYQPTDLVVVDGIQYRRTKDGGVSTSGGTMRVWADWAPRNELLTARKYAYDLPLEEGVEANC